MGKNPQTFRDCCLFFSEKLFLTEEEALFFTEEETAVPKRLRIFPHFLLQAHIFTSRIHQSSMLANGNFLPFKGIQISLCMQMKSTEEQF